MNTERVKSFIGNENTTIVDVMERIDRNARGILFIEDNDGKLVGCITDGDIRRWLLQTGDLNTSARNVMKKNPKYLFADERNRSEDMLRREKISAIPLLNKQRKIVDIILLSEISDVDSKKEKANLFGVPVVIMAGGKGTRLYPYTKILPKPLIPIGETPIVERIINAFGEYGIAHYYMTVNYKKGMIKSYFSDLESGYTISYVEEEKPLGTGGSIRLIDETFTQPLFVANCDALIRTDYGELYEFHKESGNDITMVSALKNIVVPYGVLHSKENGELISIEEKPKLSYFVNTGMYVINPETIEKIPANTMFHMTDLVDIVMKDGGKVGIYPVSEDSFLDMGEFQEMKRMEEKLNIVSE